MIDYAAARLTMVESQLRPNKVTNEALLEAFLAVPRERFVPAPLSGTAYVDNDLPLGNGRYLLAPMLLGRMLELAEIDREDRVLEIGCASGYGTAVLARLARSVVAVESDARLVAQAMTRLRELGIDNAAVLEGSLAAGYPGRAPYDVIVCEGAVERIPAAIAQQLADRGRLVTVMREPGAMSRAVLMTSAGGTLSRRPAFDAAAPLLPGFQAEPSFVF